MKTKREQIKKRRASIRKTVYGTSEKPRLTIFRSNKNIFAQLIDDSKNVTIIGMSDKAVRAKDMKKVVSAENLGKEFAKVANTKGIKEIVFDRNGYKFHGRIKAFAESVRASGLKF